MLDHEAGAAHTEPSPAPVGAAFLREYFRGTQGRIYLGVIRNAGSKLSRGEIAHLITRNSAEIGKFLAEHDKPEHECAIYYCTGTLKPGATKRTAAECQQFSSIFSDTDDHNHELDRARVIELLEAAECPPTIIVNSGHGLQPKWLLSEPSEDFKRIKAARKRLHALTASDAVHDAPRFMRLPGSHNSKNGDWLPVEVVSYHPERRYTLEVIEEWLDNADIIIPRKVEATKGNGKAAHNDIPFTVPPSAGPGTDHKRGAAWAQAAFAASARELANAQQGSRHGMLLKKAKRMGTMIARGWIDVQEVRSALYAAAETCGEIKEYGLAHFEKTFADGMKYGIATPHTDLPNDEPPRALDHGNPQQAEPNTDSRGAPHHAREKGINVLSAKELNIMRFDPIKYVVPGIIVEGLTLLAAKPKMGKSWLMLHTAIAVARGGFTLGDIHCAEGDVLYCALEDNLRRLQSRMTKLLGITQEWPARLFFRCEMPRLAEGGLNQIKEWIKAANHPRLVIIDTLAMVRTPKKRDESSYDADYAAVKELRTLANEHGVAIVLVHHLRKQEADDAFDTVSGTLGLTGAPDTILVLKRDNSGNTVLHGRGRDLVEIEKALTFNPDACIWTIAGELRDIRTSNERKAVLAAMREIELPASPSTIAAAANMKNANVRKLLPKLIDTGVIKKCDYGKYDLLVEHENA
jgi:AAA domain